MSALVRQILAPLNEEQMAVAMCQGPCMVIAGPGSGKTNTISRKIAALLQEANTRVVAVTFTREAALELRARTIALAGDASKPRLLVGTFHSVMQLMSFPEIRSEFGRDILEGRPWPFGRTKWKVVQEGSRRSYIARAMNEIGEPEMDIDDASRIIEQVKSGRTAQEVVHEKLAHVYEDILARHKVIDFQDILLRTIRGVKDGSVPSLNVTHGFIDEYQDTDLPQFEMARFLHENGTIVTGVGDDDQSIYGFRNALGYEGVLMFEREFRAERLMLGKNYRSHGEIVSAASRVIDRNLSRVEKTMIAMKGDGGRTRWQVFKTRDDEAHAAAVYAQEALRKSATAAIFARNNRRLDEVEAKLSRMGIPYRRAAGESILAKHEVMLFGKAIETVIKPERRAIDELLSWNGVTEDGLRKLDKCFRGSMVLGQADDFKRFDIDDETKKRWRDFVQLFTGWEETLKAGAESLLIRGIYEWLSVSAPDKRSQSMLDIARDMYSPRRANPDKGIDAQGVRERLAAIKAAREKADQKKEGEDEKATAVDLMTAHGSKGLEFDYVWIVGAEDEVFPAKDGALEEERRLMFVAMTRARIDLMLSTGGGKPPSPFLAESGIERIVPPEQPEEEEAVEA
ncbi:ATP-dependent helicase [Paraburkholderia sp. J8-2]|uniref:ATP-dependent helicase n=1 Tax=Paraburkholderia sp. J8-2 TaxID=2805440 RepID=UPI002AB63D89|nr:ATP-dependent helicase [Paraburkholderia sp. J8-2]